MHIIFIIIISAIAYNLFSVNFSSQESQVQKTSSEEVLSEGFSHAEKFIGNVVKNIASDPEGKNLLQKILIPQSKILPSNDKTTIIVFNPQDISYIHDLIRVEVLESSESEKIATCGFKAKITHKIYNRSKALLEEKTEIRQLGGSYHNILVDNIACGMKLGQKNQAFVDKNIIKFFKLDKLKNYQDSIFLEVLVEDVLEEMKDKIKIYDTATAYIKPYFCGENAEFDLKITAVDEESVKYDKKVSITIGGQNYPKIFTKLVGKIPVGQRTLIVRGSEIDIPSIILDKKKIYLFEMQNFVIPKNDIGYDEGLIYQMKSILK